MVSCVLAACGGPPLGSDSFIYYFPDSEQNRQAYTADSSLGFLVFDTGAPPIDERYRPSIPQCDHAWADPTGAGWTPSTAGPVQTIGISDEVESLYSGRTWDSESALVYPERGTFDVDGPLSFLALLESDPFSRGLIDVYRSMGTRWLARHMWQNVIANRPFEDALHRPVANGQPRSLAYACHGASQIQRANISEAAFAYRAAYESATLGRSALSQLQSTLLALRGISVVERARNRYWATALATAGVQSITRVLDTDAQLRLVEIGEAVARAERELRQQESSAAHDLALSASMAQTARSLASWGVAIGALEMANQTFGSANTSSGTARAMQNDLPAQLATAMSQVQASNSLLNEVSAEANRLRESAVSQLDQLTASESSNTPEHGHRPLSDGIRAALATCELSSRVESCRGSVFTATCEQFSAFWNPIVAILMHGQVPHSSTTTSLSCSNLSLNAASIGHLMRELAILELSLIEIEAREEAIDRTSVDAVLTRNGDAWRSVALWYLTDLCRTQAGEFCAAAAVLASHSTVPEVRQSAEQFNDFQIR
jgi:hypothetical protein